MQRRLFLSTLLILFIGVGIGLGSYLSGHSNALGANPAQASAPEIGTDKAAEGTFNAYSPAASTGVVPVKQEPLSTVEILDSLQHKAVETLHAGWFHVHEEKQFPPGTDNGIFPNGKRIPAHQINDSWVHLDETGNVIEAVFIMRSFNGEVVQVAVQTRDGTTWNSATGEVSPCEEVNTCTPSRYTPPTGNLTWDLRQAQERGAQVSVHTDISASNGKSGTEILITDLFDEPVSTADSEQPLTGAATRAIFDPQTGYLLLKEVVFTLQDGSTEVFPRSAFSYAYEQPSEEVLAYLRQMEANK